MGEEGDGAGIRRDVACVHRARPMCSVLREKCSVWRRMCSVFSGMCSLWRGMCSVFGGGGTPSRPSFGGIRAGSSGGSGQVFGDAGIAGMCPLWQADVSTFRFNVSSFGPDVSTFRPNVSGEEGQRGEGRAVRAEGEVRWGSERGRGGRLRWGSCAEEAGQRHGPLYVAGPSDRPGEIVGPGQPVGP